VRLSLLVGVSSVAGALVAVAWVLPWLMLARGVL
jgi:hypothetical protein